MTAKISVEKRSCFFLATFAADRTSKKSQQKILLAYSYCFFMWSWSFFFHYFSVLGTMLRGTRVAKFGWQVPLLFAQTKFA